MVRQTIQVSSKFFGLHNFIVTKQNIEIKLQLTIKMVLLDKVAKAGKGPAMATFHCHHDYLLCMGKGFSTLNCLDQLFLFQVPVGKPKAECHTVSNYHVIFKR